MKPEHNIFTRRILLGGYLLLITWLSLMPGNQLPALPLLLHADKLVHAGFYAILAILIASAQPRGLRQISLPLACLLSAGYGLLLEIAQIFTPTRSFEWTDVLANAFGAALACIGLARWRQQR